MDLAEKIGVSYPRINELVRGKRGVTPDTALRLEKLFGMEAQFWLNLQLAWDLYHAAHSPAAKKIRKIQALARPRDSRNPLDVECKLQTSFLALNLRKAYKIIEYLAKGSDLWTKGS